MIKLAAYPHYFEIPNYLNALDKNTFEIYRLQEEDLSTDLEFDIIFAQIGETECEREFLMRQKSALICGFELGAYWNPNDVHFDNQLLNQLIPYDIVCCWMEYFNLLFAFLCKQKWEFPPIFDGNVISHFVPSRKRSRIFHGINRYCPGYYSTTFPFLGNNLEAFNLEKFCFSLGSREKEYEKKNIKYEFLQPHMNLPMKEYLDLLSTCRLMFQYYFMPSFGQSIVDAVRVGIPCIGSPFWYQQVLFPGLLIYNTNQAQEILSWDYELFEPYVSRAQKIFKWYNIANPDCIQQYNKYVIQLVKEKRNI